MDQNGQRPAQRARIERRVRNTELERIVSNDFPVIGELWRGEFRAHGRQRRSACREGHRREARTREIERDPRPGMRLDEMRDHLFEYVAHVVVANDGDGTGCGDIGRAARGLEVMGLIARQRDVDARGVQPGRKEHEHGAKPSAAHGGPLLGGNRYLTGSNSAL